MARIPAATTLLLLLPPVTWCAAWGCAPAPDHAVLMLGTRELRFHRADLEAGGGVEPVWLRLRAQSDDGSTSLELTLYGEPGINLSRFAGRTFGSSVAPGRPGSATLEVRDRRDASVPVGPAGDLVVQVRASAPGILHAEAKGALAGDGAPVPIELWVERR